MPTSHTRSYELAFSLNKQSTITVPVADANINKKRAMRNFTPIRETHPAAVSDRPWFGKGHPFATFRDRIQKMYEYGATERSASDLECLWALAYVMGNDVVTGSGPYTHTLTWQDVATNKEVRYTTLVEAQGTEYKKRLAGAYVSRVTIRGERNDHVMISYEGGGRRYEDSSLTMPAVTTAVFLKTLFGTATFGASGAELGISAEILSWSVTLNQNPIPMFLMGNTAGQEDILTEVLIGDQTTEAEVVIKVNATHRNRFLNQNTCGLTIVAKDGTLATTLTIAIPNLVLTEEAFGEESSTVSYTLRTTDQGVLKVGAVQPITCTLVAGIDGTAILVNG